MPGRKKAEIEAARTAVIGDDEPFWRHWRDASKYPPRSAADPTKFDIFAFCPRATTSLMLENAYSRADIEHALWRWQYLRRQPEYQTVWEKIHDQGIFSSAAFGLVFGFPDPADHDPILVKFDHLLGIHGQRTFIQILDLSKAFSSQVDRIRKSFNKAKASYDANWGVPESKGPYDSQLLRVLDAHRDKAISADIGRIIFGKQRDGGYSDLAAEQLRKAQNAQKALAPINKAESIYSYTVRSHRGDLYIGPLKVKTEKASL